MYKLTVMIEHKIEQVKQHDYNGNERGQNTHDQVEQVKIPLLPNKVGKRSGTRVTTYVHEYKLKRLL